MATQQGMATYLHSGDPREQLSLQDISHKTLKLAELSLIRIISGLTPLSTDEGCMAQTTNRLRFQLKFGLKQAGPNHISLGYITLD